MGVPLGNCCTVNSAPRSCGMESKPQQCTRRAPDFCACSSCLASEYSVARRQMEDLPHFLVKCHLAGVNHYIRPFRHFERIVDACVVSDLAAPRFLVEAFRVAAFANLQGGRDIDLVET